MLEPLTYADDFAVHRRQRSLALAMATAAILESVNRLNSLFFVLLDQQARDTLTNWFVHKSQRTAGYYFFLTESISGLMLLTIGICLCLRRYRARHWLWASEIAWVLVTIGSTIVNSLQMLNMRRFESAQVIIQIMRPLGRLAMPVVLLLLLRVLNADEQKAISGSIDLEVQ